jgi:anti-anti-sigma factor
MAPCGSSTYTIPPRGVVAIQDGRAGGTVIWLRGEHDLTTVETIANAVAAVMALPSVDLVVDLSGVAFLGAAPAGALLRARILLSARERRLVLRDPPSSVRRVLELCGLGDTVSADIPGSRGASRGGP